LTVNTFAQIILQGTDLPDKHKNTGFIPASFDNDKTQSGQALKFRYD